MPNTNPSAVVITRAARTSPPDMPWLRATYGIEACEWITLPDADWRALADGDPVIWAALERKLLIGFYVRQPTLVAVVGHPAGDARRTKASEAKVDRIVRRIRSLLLPTTVLGFLVDKAGFLEELVDPDEPSLNWHAELAAAESTV